MQQKILITGCAGFIGSHLAEKLLADGNSVIGIDCFRDYYDPTIKERNISGFVNHPNFTLIREDICQMDSFPDVEYVFHLAAQAGVRASWGSSFDRYTHDNIIATQRLLEWYKDKKELKKFVYASSSSVYGDASVYPVSEKVIPQPISPYGVTKLAAEHLCHLYYVNYGVPTVSLRYFTVYGPRQRPDMAIHKFMRAIVDGKEIEIYGDGTQMRDFTYVDDVIRANILAAEKGVPGEVYNVGGGNRIELLELIRIIEKNVGRRVIVTNIRYQKGDVKDTWASIVHMKEINWSPLISIKSGIGSMWDWFTQISNNNSDLSDQKTLLHDKEKF
ncbi:NAD-dependent epimerase/dehydratase family protein [uncultured Methanospirillum sp.]|uniref:NAD-dependent epimerase/dehydratase family protein n=1 Tax=uncultured Methanospirillum sp. TaxID=262503 RepID=UPI0029C80E64|nr:NAD-dependent epimerase/dehydratase family protein [uncultured Methanospirillum sp.]